MKKRKNKISNKLTYTLIAIVSLILIGVGVYAYGTTNPPVMGHTMGELTPPSGCSSGQVLSWTGSAWQCAAGGNYWTDSGAYVKPTSGDKVGAPGYCNQYGMNCFEAGQVRNVNTFRCPPRMVHIEDTSSDNNEWLVYLNSCYPAPDVYNHIVLDGIAVRDGNSFYKLRYDDSTASFVCKHYGFGGGGPWGGAGPQAANRRYQQGYSDTFNFQIDSTTGPTLSGVFCDVNSIVDFIW